MQRSPQCAHTARTNLPPPEEKLTPPGAGRRDNPPHPVLPALPMTRIAVIEDDLPTSNQLAG